MSTSKRQELTLDRSLTSTLFKFPVCGLEEAVSVACIVLKYSVDIYPKKEKDEKADATTVSFVLDDNIHESEDEIENNAPIKPTFKRSHSAICHRKSKSTIRRPTDWTAQFLLRPCSSTSTPNIFKNFQCPSQPAIFHEEIIEENEDTEPHKKDDSATTPSVVFDFENVPMSVSRNERKVSSQSEHSTSKSWMLQDNKGSRTKLDSGKKFGKVSLPSLHKSKYSFKLNTSDNSPTPHLQSVSTYEESVQPSHTERLQETDKLDTSVTSQETDKMETSVTSSLLSRRPSYFSYDSTDKEYKAQTEPTPGCCGCGRVRKDILRGISLYFNPGELVGIMGPSGCGKTTFLDLLTGRRKTGNISGEIYVNGHSLDKVRQKYIANTGYVLQLATPYYEELTVRENLTLAAHMKLPNKMTWRQKFERVEQVMEVTGLLSVQDTKVGGASGPGLSGGQKKRLVIALQLLTMPKVIFLDEPTSGLDATASIELLSHLNRLAYSNRTVVLTIHQPRFEIFYMFHKLILLSDGNVAYHGVPQKAYSFFVEALMSEFLKRGLILPQLEEHNPADVIMDMLGKPWMREIILEHYQNSTEQELIKWAIKRARVKDFESMSIQTLDRQQNNPLYIRTSSTLPPNLSGNNKKKDRRQPQANWFTRWSVLEARASKRTTVVCRLYLPIIFFAYGVLLGTVYFQQDTPILIMSGFCVYSVASALFMFPVLQNYYLKALEVYGFEKADGAGRSHDLICQGFFRFVTMAIIPVVLCALVLYLLLVNMTYWSATVFLQLVVVAMALNQTWISLLIFIISALPSYAFRLSPIISSVAGFTSGFFIPRDDTPWVYRWLFYINPNYYGFSASASFLLTGFKANCTSGESEVECYLSSGDYILQAYNFDDVQPYVHIAILLLMTLVYLILAVSCNWLRHTTTKHKIRGLIRSDDNEFIIEDEETSQFTDLEQDSDVYGELDDDDEYQEESNEKDELFQSYDQAQDDVFAEPLKTTVLSPVAEEEISDEQSLHDDSQLAIFADKVIQKKSDEEIELESIHDEDETESIEDLTEEQEKRNKRIRKISRPKQLDLRTQRGRNRVNSLFLQEGQQHMVYKPGKHTQTFGTNFPNLSDNLKKAESPSPATTPRTSLKERLEDFNSHVKATQEVVKERTEELINSNESDPKKRRLTFKDVSAKVTSKLKEDKQPRMAAVVENAMAKMSSKEDDHERQESISNPAMVNYSPATIANAWRAKVRAKRQFSTDRNNVVAVPMDKLHELKKRVSQSSFSPKHFQVEPDIVPGPTTVRFTSDNEESNQLSQSTPNWKNLKPILKKMQSDNNVLEQKKTKPLLVAHTKSQSHEEPQSSLESTISQTFTELADDPEIPAHYFSGNDHDRLEEELLDDDLV